ncbi:unnamed protein product [Miscanthus lutarioriparius]|uniref:Uncharacterized protein n=1 Tax=Miscanthus lutarioriparius TaxID=422564 RepID=A0A811MRX8_9POAL|nr:unnamed protein product [Miscanthus lutarioriparius]
MESVYIQKRLVLWASAMATSIGGGYWRAGNTGHPAATDVCRISITGIAMVPVWHVQLPAQRHLHCFLRGMIITLQFHLEKRCSTHSVTTHNGSKNETQRDDLTGGQLIKSAL